MCDTVKPCSMREESGARQEDLLHDERAIIPVLNHARSKQSVREGLNVSRLYSTANSCESSSLCSFSFDYCTFQASLSRSPSTDTVKMSAT